MFYLLAFSLLMAQPNGAPDQTAVALVSGETDSFEEWVLRLDNNQDLPFTSSGTLNLRVPEDSVTFEIVDENGQVRYLGNWEAYSGQDPVRIEVGGLVLHQVVSANRIKESQFQAPAEIAVIRMDEQPERGLTQTSDLLKEEAEVNLQKTNLGGGSPIMRGMSGNRVLLMVDGFRLNNATYRLGLNQYLNTVPGGSLDQIEVMSGPSGVQYGSDGLGGTIHLRSGDPAGDGGDNLHYQGFYSTADGTNTHQVRATGRRGNLSLGGHFSFNDYSDLEAGGDLGEQIATGYDAWDGSMNLTWDLGEGRKLRMINSISDARDVPRTDRIISGRDLVWAYDPQKFQLHGLRYEASLNSKFVDFMDVGLGFMASEEGTRRISAGSPDQQRDEFTFVDTWQVNGTFTKLTGHVQWVWGFDTQTDVVDGFGEQIDLITGAVSPRGGKFPDDSDYESLGVFVAPVIQLTRDADLRLGLRYTDAGLTGTLEEPIGFVDQRFSQLTPSATFSWTMGQHFFSVGASQGFRAPTLEDSLSLGFSNQGFDAPNPDLEPEQLWSYEATWRMRTTKSLLQATAYTSRYTDLMDKVPGTWRGSDTFEGEQVFILDNVGKATIDGASLQYQHRFNKLHSLRGDAAYVYGYQDDAQDYMRRIPPLRGNLGYSFTQGDLRLSGVFSWAQRQDKLSAGDISDNRIPEGGTPGYEVIHLRGHYAFSKQFSLNLAVENITDKLYKVHGSGVFEPGRRVVLEVKASLR